MKARRTIDASDNPAILGAARAKNNGRYNGNGREWETPPEWHEDVVGHAEVRYLRGRVRFLTGGPYRASGFFPSVVVVWRPPT